jgi:predicted N-acetyltransferase YhbS
MSSSITKSAPCVSNMEKNDHSSSAIGIRGATFDDYEQIKALQQRNGLGTKPREEWEHIWLGNPVWQERMNGSPIGFVAEANSGEIVGYLANIALTYQFEGQETLVSTTQGLTVDPPYRGQAIFLIKRALRAANAQFVIVTSAKPSVSKILDRIMVRVPTGDWDYSRFWITNYSGFLGSVLETKALPRTLSYAGAPSLWLRDKLMGTHSWAHRGDGQAMFLPRFDERFSRFWEELKRDYPKRLMATRSLDVLQWHFKYALAQNRMWLFGVGDDSRILAYGIFCRQDSPQFGLKRMRLIDFQTLGDRNELVVPIMALALQKCKENGIHMLEAFGFRPDKQQVIDALSPHRRRLPGWSFFYKCWNKAMADKMKDPGVWDPTHFDGDASL